MITVVAHIHPFSPHKRIEKNYEAGTTLEHIITDLQVPPNGLPIILVDGIKTDDIYNSPADGASVVIRNIPRGAGNTNTENVGIGKMAVGAAAFLVGIALFPLGVGAGIISALVFSGIGLLALGGITYSMLSIYDPIKTFASESLPSLRGGQNKASKWGKIPLVLGKHLVVPNLAAAQYTEVATSSGGTDGDTQYLRQLFCLGYAPLKISQIKLGENLLSTNAADVRNGAIDTSTGIYADVELEIYQDGTASALYPDTVLEDAVAAQLPSGEETWRTTDEACTKISWDIWFPMGIYKVVDGVPANKTVTIEVRSRAVGSGTAWASCTLLQTLTLTKANATTLRHSSSATVASGQYEVGVKRITADDAGQEQSAATWMYLRSIKTTVAPVAADVRSRHVYLAVKAKASDTVNGALDTLSCVAEAVAPDYSGTGSGSASWVSGTTANPAAMLLLALRGTSNPRPVADTKIDWARLEEFHAFCETNGHECNAVVSSGMKMRSLLQQIAQCGRASLIMRDGLYSVVIDSARTTIVQHFTPRNVRDFRWTRAFDKIPHALRMSFISEADSWTASERLVCDDDYTEETATEIEKVDVWGITDEDAVWKKGRYMLAGMRLRPEMYQFETDAEGIVCEPGDLVAVAHDAIVVGLVPGARIKSVTVDGSGNATALVLDTPCPMEAGGSYGVRVRLAGGTSVYRAVTTAAGEQTTITLATSIPAATVPAVGDLVTFGEADIETIKCIVIGYEALEDLGVRIYCVDQADAIHSADSGTIPAYVSHVSRPPAALPQSSSDEDIAAGLAEARAAQLAATAATTSLAPAAIAQYNPAYTPELPDDPAGMTYGIKNVAAMDTCTVSTNADGSKTVTATGTDPKIRVGPVASNVGGKLVIFDITVPAGTSLDSAIGYYIKSNTIAGYTEITTLSSLGVTQLVAGERNRRIVYLPATSYTYGFFRLDIITQNGGTYTIHDAYVGTGAYLSPTLDTSGNGNHLTNTAAVPVSHNGRKWWAFNGATSNLVATTAILGATGFFSRRIRTPAAFTEQFICGNLSGNTGCALKIMTGGTLRLAVGNGTTVVNLDTTVAASTEYWIACYIGATSATLYKDGATADTDTVTMGASSTAWVEGKDPASAASYWKGYTAEPYATTVLPSAAQIRDLYYNGLPAELYTLADYAARTLVFSGPTIFKYASGAVVPSPTSVDITATPQAYTPTAYQWQYYAAGWNNLANESGKVSGVTTATLTLTYDATVWSTDAVLRLRCTADGISRELTVYKVADGAGLTIKGTVLEPADLGDIVSPATGDVYIVLGAGSYGGVTYAEGDGARYTGSAWENIGAIQGPAGRSAPQYLGIGLLADTANATFRLDTVDSDGTITTGTNVTAVAGDLMVNHHATYEAVGIYLFDGTNWAITTSARYLQLASIDIENLFTGGISIGGVEVIQTAIINNLKTRVIAFEESVSAIKRATAGTLTAGDTQISMGYDPAIPRWAAGATVVLGYIIREAGNYYTCSTAGTTGSASPTWPSSGTVNDGTAVWRFVSAAEYEFAVSKYLGTVGGNEVWQKQFLTKALRYGLIGLLLIGGLESCAPIYSDPGRVWYQQTIGAYIRRVATGNSVWAGGGEDGNMLYSPDSESWTILSSVFSATSNCGVLLHGEDRFLAGTDRGEIGYSLDGESYTVVTSPFGGSAITAGAYGNGIYILATDDNKIARSVDGCATWALVSSPLASGAFTGAAFDGSQFALSSTDAIIYSSDGISYSNVSGIPHTEVISGIICGNGKWVTFGANGEIGVASTITGWGIVEYSPFGTSNINGGVYADGKYVLVGDSGKIASSYEANLWDDNAESPYGTRGYYIDIAYSEVQKKYVSCGYDFDTSSGLLITSSYLEAGMGFTSRIVDTNNRPYFKTQDGTRLYDSRGSVRAWARVNMRATANVAFSYSWTGKVYITTTGVSHRLIVGHKVYLQISSGSLPSGVYEVSGIISSTRFTVEYATPLLGTNFGELRMWEILDSSENVYGVTYLSKGIGYLLIDEAIESCCITASAGDSDANYQAQCAFIDETTLQIKCVTAESNSYAHSNNFNVAVIG